jgi:hypothetical protein
MNKKNVQENQFTHQDGGYVSMWADWQTRNESFSIQRSSKGKMLSFHHARNASRLSFRRQTCDKEITSISAFRPIHEFKIKSSHPDASLISGNECSLISISSFVIGAVAIHNSRSVSEINQFNLLSSISGSGISPSLGLVNVAWHYIPFRIDNTPCLQSSQSLNFERLKSPATCIPCQSLRNAPYLSILTLKI